ncbi:hypothetical protein BJ912DRAFT_846763 [Pholiota molesta]|nr:hypothetical protein BJ912DRAFT_846763 [Pholiota molesta]
MVNPGAFFGTRKEFLSAQSALYADAVAGNHAADTVADIQRRYFKCYPMSLLHTVEPSADFLAQVDDNAPDQDFIPPDQAILDDEAFKAAQIIYDGQVKLLKFRKGQITRRLAYQYAKDENSTKHITVGSEDPMTVLLAKLAGIPVKKPRMKTAYILWGQRNRQAALRTKVYKECFAELDEEERKDYENEAAEEHRAALERIEEALNAPPSSDPADCQHVLKGLPTFVQPILDLIADYTGWKATLLVGGPEPADQGRLNMMSFHSGETVGNIKMNFGRAERQAYKAFVMPIFGNFLKKCYSKFSFLVEVIFLTNSVSMPLPALSFYALQSPFASPSHPPLSCLSAAPSPAPSLFASPPSTPSCCPSPAPAPCALPPPTPSPYEDSLAKPNDPESSPPRKRLRSSRIKGINGGSVQGTTSAVGHAPAPSAVATTGIPLDLDSSMPAVESTAPLTQEQLAGCPDWFLKAYQMLLSNDLGPSWVQLVRAWAHFEKDSGYEEQAKLGSAGRPPCVTAWIARARSVTYKPDLYISITICKLTFC